MTVTAQSDNRADNQAADHQAAEGLLDRIAGLHDLLAKNAAQGEADRRVPAGQHRRPARGRRVQGRHPAPLRRLRDLDADHARRVGRGRRGRRRHGLGRHPAQRVRLAHRPVPRAGPGRRVQGRPGRAGLRRAGPDRPGGQGGRRLADHRPLVLQLRLLARHLGRARDPRHRRVRRGQGPGGGPDPGGRHGGRGHLVRGGHEVLRQQLPGRHRRVRARAPGAVGAGRRSRATTAPSTPTRCCTAPRWCRSWPWS